MSMTPGLRQLALAAHVTVSLSWIGSVAISVTFLVVHLAGGMGGLHNRRPESEEPAMVLDEHWDDRRIGGSSSTLRGRPT